MLELLFSQAGWGVPPLYSIGALCMGLMVIMVWGYVRKFGVDPSLMKANKKKKVRKQGVATKEGCFWGHEGKFGCMRIRKVFHNNI